MTLDVQRLDDTDAERVDDSHLQHAIQLVDDEQDIADALAAYDRFIRGISQLTVDTPAVAGRSATGGGPQSVGA